MNKVRIIPEHKSGTENSFTSVMKVKPFTVGELFKIKTAPLKPDMKVNLLALSFNAEWVGAGLIDVEDIVDSTVILSKVYIEINDIVKVFDVSNRPKAAFVRNATCVEHESEMFLDNTFVLKGPEISIEVHGYLDVNLGNLQVNFICSDHVIVGYEVIAYRKKPNKK